MTEEVKAPEETGIEAEDRIDEFGISQFVTMGYKDRLSDTMVKVYTEFKRRKDTMQAGRLTPEGAAFVAVIADVVDGVINLKSDVAEAPGE